MGNDHKRCCICGEFFSPHPRTAEIQKVCFKDSCRYARVQRNFQRWVKFNPDYQKRRQAKVRAWAKAYPNYWKHYRDDNPPQSYNPPYPSFRKGGDIRMPFSKGGSIG